ncbi:hypothetical protein KY312_02280 [Candidatus Woesearchaeota archaeon]|nr:hypothetical protein [Candidatus Woesearchaeota archaeon]
MGIEDQIIDEIQKRGREKLSDHIYGLRHELIGKACLYRGSLHGELKPAIPYGAYILDGDGYHNDLRFAIAYYDPESSFEGEDMHVKVLAGVQKERLIPLDPSSRNAQEVYHTILSWLIDNRPGKYKPKQEEELQKV